MFERVVLLHERQYLAVKEQLCFVDQLLVEISKRTKVLKAAAQRTSSSSSSSSRKGSGGSKSKGGRSSKGGSSKSSSSSSKAGGSSSTGGAADGSEPGAQDAGGADGNGCVTTAAATTTTGSSSSNSSRLDVGAVATLLKDLCDATVCASRHKEAQAQLLGLARQQQDVQQLEELIAALKEVYVTWLRDSVEKLEQQDRDFSKFRALLPQQAAWTALHHASYAGDEPLLALLLAADAGFAGRQQALVKVHRKLYGNWSRKRWGVTGGHNALYNPGRALKEANEVRTQAMLRQKTGLPRVHVWLSSWHA
jgi:hypothetical protein